MLAADDDFDKAIEGFSCSRSTRRVRTCPSWRSSTRRRMTAFMEEAPARAAIVQGDPLDPATQIEAALVRAKLEKILSYFDIGSKQECRGPHRRQRNQLPATFAGGY